MTGAKDEKSRTHNAYAFKRETRISGKWLEIGDARLDIDVARLPEHLRPLAPEFMRHLRGNVYLNRTPIGGFSGHVFLNPMGEKPPAPGAQTQQTQQAADAYEEE